MNINWNALFHVAYFLFLFIAKNIKSTQLSPFSIYVTFHTFLPYGWYYKAIVFFLAPTFEKIGEIPILSLLIYLFLF